MEAKAHEQHHEIFIDRHRFEVTASSLTGAELRNLPSSPIGENFDLYLEVPGGEDALIGDTEHVPIRSGMHFFSVPKTINPGS